MLLSDIFLWESIKTDDTHRLTMAVVLDCMDIIKNAILKTKNKSIDDANFEPYVLHVFNKEFKDVIIPYLTTKYPPRVNNDSLKLIIKAVRMDYNNLRQAMGNFQLSNDGTKMIIRLGLPDTIFTQKWWDLYLAKDFSVNKEINNIADVFTHEVVHYLQSYNRKKDIDIALTKSNNRFLSKFGDDRTKYLLSKMELQAWSSNIANDFIYDIDKGRLSYDTLLCKLKTTEGQKELISYSQYFKMYYDIYQQTNNKDAWKYLIKNIINNLHDWDKNEKSGM